MKQKYFLSLLLLMVFDFTMSLQSSGQVTISGPACVSEGATYLYEVRGEWDSSTIARICVSGGTLAEQADTCTSGLAFSYIKVIWTSGLAKGVITISFAGTESSLTVNISKPLSGGFIDSSSKTQILDTLTVPSLIDCSPATGGNCFPDYSYQWQSSDDGTKWTDIEGATDAEVILKDALKTTMFYRRRATESGSGSIGYSDIATVFINY